MKEGNFRPEEIVGIGLDVTSATVVAVDETGTPLSMLPEFADRPEAWMKLWKHHGAMEIADRMLEVARERKESWLSYYGDWLSSELFMPKAVELAMNDPEAFARTWNLTEAADWLVWKMTGELTRSISMAGCNSLYRQDTGYPSREYFKAICPQAEAIPDKLRGKMMQLGERAGYLLPEVAERLGLLAGTPVGVAAIDSHSAVIGCGAARVGDMVSTIGTSANNMLNAVEGPGIPGIYSAAPDANIPGLFGYEGGQNCVGDCLAWFVDNCVPEEYIREAKREGKNIHTYLQERAERLKPGESGLLALDWFNGVRTPRMDFSLTGTIVGLTVRTKPEEIYRALVEATVFGNQKVIDTFEEAGCPVKRIIAAGGIPMKNSMMMQIYADVSNRDIYLCGSRQASALGSAILGAAAAGPEVNGCDNIYQLIERLGKTADIVYHPIPENVEKYRKLYAQYNRLADVMAEAGSVGRELLKLKH
jgi:L-ribulokinase